jgi:hypothetical protein
MSHQDPSERTVVVHIAGTSGEAMVIRGLLQSEGIDSPGSTSSDPFPLRENPEGTHGVEIMVLESQADTARKLIQSHLTAKEVERQEEELKKRKT